MQVLLLGVRRLFVGRNKGKGHNPLSFTKISAVAAVCRGISLSIPPFGWHVSWWGSFWFNKP